MGSDRFVYWKEKKPAREQLGMALEDYLGQGSARAEWNAEQDRWFVSFPGPSSDPCARMDPSRVRPTTHPERWFEVVPGADNMDVITRSQDPFVSAAADGFVKFCCRYWQADPPVI